MLKQLATQLLAKLNWRSALVLVLLMLGLGGLYLFLLRPQIVGLWMDDAVYLTAAQSLANGHGYRIISDPAMPGLIKYPPLFPVLLAGLTQIVGPLPHSIPLLKLCMVGLDLVVLGILYALFRSGYQFSRGASAALCLVLGTNYIWLRCMLEILSEPLYMLLTLSAIGISIQLQRRETHIRPRELALLILLSVATFYTRTIGLALITGLSLWLWKRYNRSIAFTFGSLCLLLCLPWLWWTLLQPESIEKIGAFYLVPQNQSYVTEFFVAIIKFQGIVPIVLSAGALFPGALIFTLLPWMRDIPDLPQNPAWIPFLSLSLVIGVFIYSFARLLRARQVSAVACYGWFYLLLSFCWYSHGQYPRLLLCLLPFAYAALFQIFTAWQNHLPVSNHTKRWIASGVLVLVVSLNLLFPGFSAIPRGTTMAHNTNQDLWGDYITAFDVIHRNTTPNDVIWGRYNGMYHLYTGRYIINQDIIPSGEILKLPTIQERRRHFLETYYTNLKRHKVNYILLEPYINSDIIVSWPEADTLELIRTMPDRFTRVYESPRGIIRLYRVH